MAVHVTVKSNSHLHILISKIDFVVPSCHLCWFRVSSRILFNSVLSHRFGKPSLPGLILGPRNSYPSRQIITKCTYQVVLGIIQKKYFLSIPIIWLQYRFLNDIFLDANCMKSVLTKLHYELLQKLWFYFCSLLMF